MLIQRSKQFLKNIKPEDRVAVFHHGDCDGVCAAVIVSKTIKFDLRLVPEHGKVTFTDKIIKELKENKINKVICVDLAVDQDPKKVKQAEKFAELLILDHHKIYSDLSSKRTIFIKPSMIYKRADNATYPASKLTYDLFPKIPGLDIIASVGIIGDMCYKAHKTFISGVFKKYNLKQNKDIYKTKLGRLANLIEYAIIASVNFDDIFNDLYTLDYDYAIKKLKKYAGPVEAELNQAIKDFKTKAEFHKDLDLAFYEPTTTHHMSGMLSSLIAKDYPHLTLILITPIFTGGFNINARRYDFKVPVNDLLEKACKKIRGASGGGHVPAAGAYVPFESKQKFKKQVIEILKSFI